MPLSTVYRTLNDLQDMRLVSDVGSPSGKTTYAWVDADEPHHHLVCERCGSEEDLEPELLERLRSQISQRSGFEPFFGHMMLPGLCAACAAAEAATNAPNGKPQEVAHGSES